MMTRIKIKTALALAALAITGSATHAAAEGKPLRVYILAGQSNMQGSAHQRTFAAIGDDPKTAPLLSEILDQNGDPVVCDNAWITYQTRRGDADSIRKVVPNYDAEQGYELAGFVWFQGWNDMCNRHHIEQYTGNMIHFISDVRTELDAPTMPFIVGILGVYGTTPDKRKFDKGLPVTEFRKTQFAAVRQYDRKVAAQSRGHVIAVDSGPYYDLELSDIYWKRRMTSAWKQRVKQEKMTPENFQEECARYGFGDGELTAAEQRTWDRCASNAEYHYLGSGKTFVRFGKALAETMLEMENK